MQPTSVFEPTSICIQVFSLTIISSRDLAAIFLRIAEGWPQQRGKPLAITPRALGIQFSVRGYPVQRPFSSASPDGPRNHPHASCELWFVPFRPCATGAHIDPDG